MKTDELTFTKVDTDKRYYMINLSGERMGNYDIRNEILAKWTNASKLVDGCGNVNYECTFDFENKKINWGIKNKDWNRDFYLSNVIDSPLLLYRLISLFKGNPEIESDPYKTIWWYNIKHIKTDKAISFGEWKGASGFWLPESSHSSLRQPFKKDLEKLLLFLVSDQIPHPYDGCTCGQIA